MSKFEENRGVPWLARDWKQGKKNNKSLFGLISLLGLEFWSGPAEKKNKYIKGVRLVC